MCLRMEYFCYLSIILFMFTSSLAQEEFIIYGDTFEINRTNTSDKNESVSCVRDHAYDRLNISEVTGKWKVLELYLHLSNEGVNTYHSCPMVTIWEVGEIFTTTFGPSTENPVYHVQHMDAKFRQEYRYLRLIWDEAGQTIEYSFHFRNDSAGYWQVFQGQNVTLGQQGLKYNQFSGTVQVLKAVNGHLLLNFCQKQDPIHGRQAQLYSILLSREPGVLDRWELDNMHSILQKNQLSIASRRLVCGNSADRPLFGWASTVIMILLAYALGSS